VLLSGVGFSSETVQCPSSWAMAGERGRLTVTVMGEMATAKNMTITVVWDVMLCGLVFRYHHYAASHSLSSFMLQYSHTLTAVPALQLFAVLNM